MTRRIALIAASILLAVGISSGAAYAYYVSTGTGGNTATVGTLQVVSGDAITTQTPDTLLQPGDSGEAIVSIHNPNNYPVTVTDVAQAGAISVSGGNGCTESNSGITFTAQAGLSVSVAASSTQLVHLPGSVSMASSSADGCQGATFDVPVSVAVQS